MNENGITGIEQGRAKFAYDEVKEIKDLPDDENGRNTKKNYKSSARGFAVLIKTNGLGQALAFLKTRETNLYGQIYTWLHEEKRLIGEGELVDEVISQDSSKYRRITTETLALMNWIRRFVDGLMPNVGGDNQ